MRAILLFLAILALCPPAQAWSFRATLLLEHGEASPWNDLLRSGLAKAGRDFGVETAVVVAPPGPEQREIFRNACAGSDLVLVASDNLHEALRDNAANFRRVKFGSVDAGIRAANIMSVTFADEQAAFLAGAAAAILAAGQSAEPVIGWLSGMDTPAMRSLFSGFAEGAQLAVPGIRVIQAISGSFVDESAAAQKAAWLASSGASVIALASGAGNAAAARSLPGVWTIALDRPAGNPRELGAIVKAADKAVYEIVKSAQSDHFRAKEIDVYDLANGGVDFAGLDQALAKSGAKASETVARRVRELRHELAQGSIRLHSLRQRTLCDCLD